MSLELDTLQHNCLTLHSRMSCDPSLDPQQLAFPFLSAPPLNSSSRRRILYVGRATAGDWYDDDYLSNPTVEGRKACTTAFLADMVATSAYNSAFWYLAHALCRIADDTSGPVGNLIWTNLVHIGVRNGNPRGRYLTPQIPLFIQMLRAEIKKYNPALIVFVTGEYAAQIVDTALDDPDGKSWVGSSFAEGYTRSAKNGQPPMLWVNHPQGKPRVDIQGWLAQAQKLLASPANLRT